MMNQHLSMYFEKVHFLFPIYFCSILIGDTLISLSYFIMPKIHSTLSSSGLNLERSPKNHHDAGISELLKHCWVTVSVIIFSSFMQFWVVTPHHMFLELASQWQSQRLESSCTSSNKGMFMQDNSSKEEVIKAGKQALVCLYKGKTGEDFVTKQYPAQQQFSCTSFHQQPVQPSFTAFRYTTRFKFGKMKAFIYCQNSGVGRFLIK